MKNLDELIEFIAGHFVFDEKSYPELKGKSDSEIRDFAIRHSALHFAKTAGKIAAFSEDLDHGDTGDIEELKKNVSKSLVHTLRLAELIGLSGEDLVRAIKERYGDGVGK